MFAMLLWVCPHSNPRSLVCYAPIELRGQIGSSAWYFGTQSSSFDISFYDLEFLFLVLCTQVKIYDIAWIQELKQEQFHGFFYILYACAVQFSSILYTDSACWIFTILKTVIIRTYKEKTCNILKRCKRSCDGFLSRRQPSFHLVVTVVLWMMTKVRWAPLPITNLAGSTPAWPWY
jgi:hypothetical protein